MVLLHTLFLLMLNFYVKCQNEDGDQQAKQHHDENLDSEHLVAHLTEIVDLEGQGLRHIQEHLEQKDFPQDGQFAEDVQAIKSGDDTKGIFYFFELHDFDKNNKLDGLELFVALTDHQDKTTAEDPKVLFEEEVENIIDNILKEHDFNDDGYIDFMELMNTGPDSFWNKLGKA